MSTESYQLSKPQNSISSQTEIILELLCKKKFCDVTLVVEEEKFEVHKMILASNIPYFNEMFSNDKYQEFNKDEITLKDLDPKIMNFILGYIYGRKPQITKDNLLKLLQHADYLMMLDLKAWCEEKLMNSVTKETCIANFLLSRRYKLSALNKKTKIFFNQNLSNIYLRDDFVELSEEEFSELWSQVEDRECAYLALMQWVKYDLLNRRGFLHESLKKIPQDGISFDFCKSKMEKEALLKDNHQCSLWLLELVSLLADKAEASKRQSQNCQCQNKNENITGSFGSGGGNLSEPIQFNFLSNLSKQAKSDKPVAVPKFGSLLSSEGKK